MEKSPLRLSEIPFVCGVLVIRLSGQIELIMRFCPFRRSNKQVLRSVVMFSYPLPKMTRSVSRGKHVLFIINIVAIMCLSKHYFKTKGGLVLKYLTLHYRHRIPGDTHVTYELGLATSRTHLWNNRES